MKNNQKRFKILLTTLGLFASFFIFHTSPEKITTPFYYQLVTFVSKIFLCINTPKNKPSWYYPVQFFSGFCLTLLVEKCTRKWIIKLFVLCFSYLPNQIEIIGCCYLGCLILHEILAYIYKKFFKKKNKNDEEDDDNSY